jgi:hypothetical protein
MSRPQSLGEVSSVVIAGTKPFAYAIDEFLDTFYLDHPDKLRQQRRIDDSPAIVGDAFVDSWIGAVGEHLARRWDLSVPAWTLRLLTMPSPSLGLFRTRRPCVAPCLSKVRPPSDHACSLHS